MECLSILVEAALTQKKREYNPLNRQSNLKCHICGTGTTTTHGKRAVWRRVIIDHVERICCHKCAMRCKRKTKRPEPVFIFYDGLGRLVS